MSLSSSFPHSNSLSISLFSLIPLSLSQTLSFKCSLFLSNTLFQMLSLSLSQALEASFTHESLARAVGINSSKGLIVAHLGEKFLLLIGPTCAQRKVDVMQMKNFVPLNPLEQTTKVTGHTHRHTHTNSLIRQKVARQGSAPNSHNKRSRTSVLHQMYLLLVE